MTDLVERLRAHRAGQPLFDNHAATMLEAADEITRLRAELESVQADALRYRWLRDVSMPTWRSFQEQWRMPAASCDAAIDAAMGAGK